METEKDSDRDRNREETAGENAGLPAPSFLMLVAGLATQVMMNLGEIANPVTGEKQVDMDHAKYTIDLLEILREKTAGNLSAEEERILGMYLYDLRMKYVKTVS